MKLEPVIVTLYGLICVAGGLLGYLQAQSLPSLLAGGIGGLTLQFLAAKMRKGHRLAAFGALLISCAIGGKFFYSYIQTFEAFPHLIMLCLSGLSAVACFKVLFQKKKQPEKAN
jgi:uncharacterized membrane protein (UPF0136 family)